MSTAHPALKRIGWLLARTIVSLWLVATFAFLIVHLVPGDPVRANVGLNAPPALVDSMRSRLGLDRSLVRQYLDYWSGLARGDWGSSLGSRLPVDEVIGQRLGNTLRLAGLAFVVAVTVALPVGFGMAIVTRGGRGRRVELGYTAVAAVLAAIPEFFLAVVLVAVFAVGLHWLPIAGLDGASSYVLPVLALAVGPAAALSRLFRAEALAVLDHEFVRAARSKRLPAWRLYGRHVLPSTTTATLTVSGLLLTGLVASTVLVESIFAWPGLGPTMVTAIVDKDYPLIQGIVLVYGALVLVVNLLVDLALAALDPRSTIGEW